MKLSAVEGDANVGLTMEELDRSPDLLLEDGEPSQPHYSASSAAHGNIRQLEARITELESKLATLSRLLQIYQGPPDKNPKTVKPVVAESSISSKTENVALPAEKQPNGDSSLFQSPHKRNLSFRLLYNDNPEEYNPSRNHRIPPVVSMTPAERRWYTRASPSRRPTPPSEVKHKWLNYLNSFQESTPDVDVQMEEFIKVPSQLEGTMSFGFFVCVDSFLYMITILPVRFVWGSLLLILKLVWKDAPAEFRFHRQHSYQMVQVAILFFIYNYVLKPISIGKLYHWIRGQAMIKLYVLIAIVEGMSR